MKTEGGVRGEPEFASERPTASSRTVEVRGFGWVAGNLVDDPAVRFTAGGTIVAKLRVATSERVRDPESGQWKEGPTRFVDVVCFGTLAQNVAEYFKRGDRVVGGGRWQRESWTGPDEKEHERFALIVRDLGLSVTFRAARYITDIVKEM